jgi:ABC-type multidrug transport system ATPase subunit
LFVLFIFFVFLFCLTQVGTSVVSFPGSGKEVVAVDSLSLGLPLQLVFGFLGTNGAGKTSTLQILTGDDTATSGTASINGFDIATELGQARRNIGYCPQFDPIIEWLTGREVCLFFFLFFLFFFCFFCPSMLRTSGLFSLFLST